MKNLGELLVDPLALLFCLSLVIGVAVFIGRYRSGRSLSLGVLLFAIWIFSMLLASAPAIVNPLLEIEESSIVENPQCASDTGSLVVLSGGVSSAVTDATQIGHMYHATFVRLSETIRLIERQDDDYEVFLLGGSSRNGVAESDVMLEFLTRTGVDKNRLTLERFSSNTRESSLELSMQFERTDRAKEIRLLTSALHMRRAKTVFEQAGFGVCPILVDRLAIPGVPWYTLLPQTTALRKFDLLLHEWVGNIVYRFK